MIGFTIPNTAINCDSSAVLSITPRFTVFDLAEYIYKIAKHHHARVY